MSSVESDLDYVRNGVHVGAQNPVINNCIYALGQVIYGLFRTMSSIVDGTSTTDKIVTAKLSTIDDDGLQINKTDILAVGAILEKTIQTSQEKLKLLEGDKKTQGTEILAQRCVGNREEKFEWEDPQCVAIE
jgi:hypothetical protein